MNVGSLFTGIGGFDLGLERVGMRVVWQCESNEYRRKVLALRFPGVPCFDDVRAVGSGAPWVDVVCGGFPCQPISVAGKGLVQDDPRWLWPEFARVVGELRPRYVVVENVSALLGRGMGDVLADLAALGYDAEWDCVPAVAAGAPHIRDRLWLVAYPSGLCGSVGGEARYVAGAPRASETDGGQWQRNGDAADDCRATLADADEAGRVERRRAEPVRAQLAPAERGGEAVADPNSVGGQSWRSWSRQYRAGWGSDSEERSWWSVEPSVGRVADGVPARVDRLSALGDSLVPQIAEWIGRQIMERERVTA